MELLAARRFMAAAALLGGSGVMAGAFGAHALKASVSPQRLTVWQTAVDYQLWHACALLALSLAGLALPTLASQPLWQWANRLFVAGTLVFSGSLYALVLSDVGLLGAITPLGGSLLIAGWLVVLALALRGTLPSTPNR